MRTARALTLTAVAASALAGCGGGASRGGAKSADVYAQAVSYADCMRSHGVPSFPDPSSGGGFDLRTSGISPGSPAYRSGVKACARLEPGGSGPPPINHAQQAGMLAKAHCLRAHGVPDFPDPTFAPGGRGIENNLTASWNPEAPASRAASKACLNVGTLIPGAGVG